MSHRISIPNRKSMMAGALWVTKRGCNRLPFLQESLCLNIIALVPSPAVVLLPSRPYDFRFPACYSSLRRLSLSASDEPPTPIPYRRRSARIHLASCRYSNPATTTNVTMMNKSRCKSIYSCLFDDVYVDPLLFSNLFLSARPGPIEISEPASFLPVFDFGSPPKSSKRLPPLPPPPPQRKLKSKRSHLALSTFLTLERLEDIEEEREDGFAPPLPSRHRGDTHRKRIARLWDFNRFSIIQQAPPSSDANSIAFDTQSIFSNTSEDDINNRYSFPLPPNTIPRQSHADDQMSPLDPDITFQALLSPLSPASPATSGSCYSPPCSGGLERFTPMTPAFSFNNRAHSIVISAAPDDKSLSLSDLHPPPSPSHLSAQHQRPCPSPDLDPELCAQSSGSSLDSDEVDGLAEEPKELDEFKIIPRLFGSWSFDAGMGICEEYSQPEGGYEDARWDLAIDEVFAMVRSRRPSAQSEFGCIPDANIPPFDKDLARKLGETPSWLLPGRAAPSPPIWPPSPTSEQQETKGDSGTVEEAVKRLFVAPLKFKKPEKPCLAPLVTAPYYPPPARLTGANSPDFDRPPPTQELPSAAFSPMSTYSILSPTSMSPFVHPVDIDSWPTWSAFEPCMDRRPSASALSLMSKFSDDSIDIKVRRRGVLTGSRKSKLSTLGDRPIVPSKAPAPPSAWFNRATNGVGSSFTRLNVIAAQTSKENKSKSSPRSSIETAVTSPISSSPVLPAQSPSPLKELKSALRKSQMPRETFLRA